MSVLKLTLVSTISLLSLSVFSFVSCSSMGQRPKGDDLDKLKSSKNYNQKRGMFVNRRQDVLDEMKKKAMNWSTIKEWLSEGENRVPSEKLPEIKPDLAEFLKKSDEIKTIWLGHSSFLLNVEGKIILVDPVLSKAASPVSFMVNRFQAPVLTMEELPKIDVIIISHDHYDHLDMETSKFFADKDVTYIVPLGVGSHLNSWGVDQKNIIEKDWWEEQVIDGVTFIATPAQHFSGRNGIHENETLWASWVIKTDKHKIYFSGDSGYDTHFKEIGEKLGPFDLAFIESGQYNERWKEVHLLPNESIQAFKDLNAKKFIPVHWGMFELALHAWDEPVEKLYSYSQTDKNFDLVTPKIGELIYINSETKTYPWWKKIKKEVAKK